MLKKCVICGAEFVAPPSAKKVTCSPSCRSERARRTHIGKSNVWSEEARERAKERDHQNLANGTAAAMLLPEGQRGEQNREAKIWTLKSPTGEIIEVVNLLNWARIHALDFEPYTTDIDATANRIRCGFAAIVSSLTGAKSRKNREVGSYKGWQLVSLPREKKK